MSESEAGEWVWDTGRLRSDEQQTHAFRVHAGHEHFSDEEGVVYRNGGVFG